MKNIRNKWTFLEPILLNLSVNCLGRLRWHFCHQTKMCCYFLIPMGIVSSPGTVIDVWEACDLSQPSHSTLSTGLETLSLRKFAHHCSWSHYITLGVTCFRMVLLDTLRIIILIAFAVGFISGDGMLWNFQDLWWLKAFWSVERQGCRKIWLTKQSMHYSRGLIHFCFLSPWLVSVYSLVLSLFQLFCLIYGLVSF